MLQNNALTPIASALASVTMEEVLVLLAKGISVIILDPIHSHNPLSHGLPQFLTKL